MLASEDDVSDLLVTMTRTAAPTVFEILTASGFCFGLTCQ